MDFIRLTFGFKCAAFLKERKGKGGKWVKGIGGLKHIGGSEGLDS